jgi:hypothetical protein
MICLRHQEQMIHISRLVVQSHHVSVECGAASSTSEQVLLAQSYKVCAAVHVIVVFKAVGISVPCLVLLAVLWDVITYPAHQVT